jgi:trans-aconitate methyltransferase
MTTRWNAADYAENSTAQAAWAAELIDKLNLRGDEAVLDIGCGDGKVTAQIAGRVPNGSVLGVDNSEQMLHFAREAFAPETWGNLSFALCDARELPFCARLDVVFSTAALHWIVDHRPVLAGIARALRPGGRVLLQMGGRGNAEDVAEVFHRLITRPQWAAYFEGLAFPWGFHGPEEYRRWLSEAGLIADRVELIGKDMVQEGEAGLAGWVRTTWMPYTSRVPEELRGELIGQVVRAYAGAHPADAEGFLHVPMVRLEVEARRTVEE